jgi:hypothetical protein
MSLLEIFESARRCDLKPTWRVDFFNLRICLRIPANLDGVGEESKANATGENAPGFIFRGAHI